MHTFFLFFMYKSWKDDYHTNPERRRFRWSANDCKLTASIWACARPLAWSLLNLTETNELAKVKDKWSSTKWTNRPVVSSVKVPTSPKVVKVAIFRNWPKKKVGKLTQPTLKSAPGSYLLLCACKACKIVRYTTVHFGCSTSFVTKRLNRH